MTRKTEDAACKHWLNLPRGRLGYPYQTLEKLRYIDNHLIINAFFFFKVGPECPTCDVNLNCTWNSVCDVSEVCMIRSYPNTKFSVHCTKVSLRRDMEELHM